MPHEPLPPDPDAPPTFPMLPSRAVIANVLIAHQRRDAGSCLCGWGVGSGALGESHAHHVADQVIAAIGPLPTGLQPRVSVAQAAYERGRDLAERADAFQRARDLLYGLEYERDDVLAVADWLLSGHADLAMAMNEQTARHYRDHTVTVDAGPDAASWTPDLQVVATDPDPAVTARVTTEALRMAEGRAKWDPVGQQLRDLRRALHLWRSQEAQTAVREGFPELAEVLDQMADRDEDL